MGVSGRYATAFFAIVAVLLVALPVPGDATPVRAGQLHAVAIEGTTQPDVVLILTDDQRFDMIDRMPVLRWRVADRGTTFTNAFVVNALCCPSRATILTGRYSHSTGVWSNVPPDGGFEAFDDASTVATWLDDAGYRTALIGKYLNGYTDASYVPPGWEAWRAVSGRVRYFDYSVSVDGETVSYGSDPEDYSTDVFASYADDFIRETPEDRPLFLALSLYAPHGRPIPAPRDADVRFAVPPPRSNFNEADVADKPAWVQALPLQSYPRTQYVRQQYRTLFAVDDAIRTVLDALRDTGRMRDTLVIFASDNGWSQGSHRWVGKRVAWEESIRIPLIVRFDPITTGIAREESRIALNLDLAQTIAELTGVEAPGAEGRSLVRLLDGSPVDAWRDDFLIEHSAKSSGPPVFCAVRSTTAKYIRYATGEEELYDLVVDPFEMQSLHADAASFGLLEQMRRRLEELCDPPPPGYEP